MREFKFFTKNKILLFEGKEVVWVGYMIYNPTTFEPIRRIRLRDDGGRIDQIEIDSNHSLWDELIGMDCYSV